MKPVRSFLATLVVLATGASAGVGQARFPGATWREVSDPTALGWSDAGLARAKAYSDSIGSTAVMIVQDGIVVDAWGGDVARRVAVHSVRKSLLSALIGIAVASGQLDTASTLGDVGIDDTRPRLTDGEKSARVVDLLTSRSGVYHPAAYETPGMERLRPARGSHAPGTFFYYNNWDFNTLGAIYEQAVGRSLFDAFLDWIAVPIGMQDLRRQDMTYFREPKSRYPAYLFSMSARDLARFGLLYLAGGSWNGKAVVPADWVRWSTRPLVDTGVTGGYGALWWVATDPRDPVIHVPVGTFSARGTGEQNVFVFPAYGLVIVHLGDPARRMIRVRQFGRLLRMILASRTLSS